jgi:hypothetical protein
VTVTQEAIYSYWTASPNEKMALETSHDPTIWPGHNNKAIMRAPETLVRRSFEIRGV